MKKRSKIIAAPLLLLSLFSVRAFSGEAGTASALFLREDPTARGFSMGGAYLALVNSPGAAYVNPAALGHITGHQAELSLWRGLDGVSRYNYAGAALSAKKAGVFSVNYLSYGSGVEDVYDLDGNLTKVELQKDYAISAGWGKNLGETFFAGGQIKSVSSKLAETYSASALTFDTGLMYKSLNDRLTLGAGARNMGGSLKYKSVSDPLPRAITLDAGYRRMLRGNTFTAGLSLQRSLDSTTIDRGIGAEYCFAAIPLAVRAGLRQVEGEFKASAGIGVSIKKVTFDYGFSGAGALAETAQRFSLRINFGPDTEAQRAAAYREKGLRKKPAAMSSAKAAASVGHPIPTDKPKAKPKSRAKRKKPFGFSY